MDADTKNVRNRIFVAFYGNIVVAFMVICIVLTFNDGSSPYLRFGWNDNLSVLGVFEVLDVFINDTIYPYIMNNVRDNNVKEIKEFTKYETRLITNGSFFISDIKYSLYIMISISQIDIALIKVLIGGLACILTTNIQLSGKTFMGDEYTVVSTVEMIGNEKV
jgi:hypothetical protein